MCLKPERAGHSGCINPGFSPPPSFIAAAMELAMVPTAQGDVELVTDLAS